MGERPDDGLLAEEGSSSAGASGRRWVVDPLDGTTNFLYGLPEWAISVALEDPDGLLVGVVHAPVTDETFVATRGGGATLNGAEIAVSGCYELEMALIATGFSYDSGQRSDQARLLAELLPRVRDVRRAGAAALDLCAVACGRVDGYYERNLGAWDWAAGSLVAAEAGAAVTPLRGEPTGLLATSPGLHDRLYEILGGAAGSSSDR